MLDRGALWIAPFNKVVLLSVISLHRINAFLLSLDDHNNGNGMVLHIEFAIYTNIHNGAAQNNDTYRSIYPYMYQLCRSQNSR